MGYQVKKDRPGLVVLSWLLFWLLLCAGAYFAADLQTKGLTDTGKETSGFLFSGNVYRYNILYYIGGLTLFVLLLVLLWRGLLKNNYEQLAESPWWCKIACAVFTIAGAIGSFVFVLLSMMQSVSMADTLAPGWAALVSAVGWPLSALALSLWGGRKEVKAVFSFLKKETHSDLEAILKRLRLNAENNYRDATKEDLEELKARYEELESAGKLNGKQIDHYSEVITTYGIKLQNFSHKTQKVNSYSEKL